MTFHPIYEDPKILLHPNIPKPLHNVNPRTIMGQEWWDMTRKRAYKDNNYCCAACGIHKSEASFHNWLEAHEDYEVDYKKRRMIIKRIVPLCHASHNYIHSGRLLVLAEKELDPKDKDFVSWQKFWEIMQHGNEVLGRAGYQPNPFAVAVCAQAVAVDDAPHRPKWAKETLLVRQLKANPIPGEENDLEKEWSSWRLIFDGKEYPPFFKSYNDWLDHYHPGARARRAERMLDDLFGFNVFDEPF